MIHAIHPSEPSFVAVYMTILGMHSRLLFLLLFLQRLVIVGLYIRPYVVTKLVVQALIHSSSQNELTQKKAYANGATGNREKRRTAARKSQNAAGEPPAQSNSNNVTLLTTENAEKTTGCKP
jgi:hypothetical protein